MNDKPTSCIVVGAGISGLLAANILQKQGVAVTVVEKSRGVGGRMATRRMDDARFDHGAQYFTVKDRIFGGWVESWENAGLIVEWFQRFPMESSEVGHARYCGRNGMTDVPKALAKELNVERGTRVNRIHFENDYWEVFTDQETRYSADFLLLTAPAPQSLELLKASNIKVRASKLKILESIQYQKCIAVMALLDGPSGIPDMGCSKIENGPLNWIADNQIKGISPDVPAITAQSTHEFADAHWDLEDAEILELMLAAVRPRMDAGIRKATLHKWRYALPLSRFGQPYFFSRQHSLMLAGDAFGGPRVEGAALSGIEAAAHLIDFL